MQFSEKRKKKPIIFETNDTPYVTFADHCKMATKLGRWIGFHDPYFVLVKRVGNCYHLGIGGSNGKRTDGNGGGSDGGNPA